MPGPGGRGGPGSSSHALRQPREPSVTPERKATQPSSTATCLTPAHGLLHASCHGVSTILRSSDLSASRDEREPRPWARTFSKTTSSWGGSVAACATSSATPQCPPDNLPQAAAVPGPRARCSPPGARAPQPFHNEGQGGPWAREEAWASDRTFIKKEEKPALSPGGAGTTDSRRAGPPGATSAPPSPLVCARGWALKPRFPPRQQTRSPCSLHKDSLSLS